MHKIAIPESAIAGAMQQRGKLNRYDHVVGPQTALAVIDLQNVFMEQGAPVEVPAAREIVPNVNRLAEAVRKAGGKVVWIQMTLNDQEKGWSVFFEGERRREAFKDMQRGSHGHALWPTLDVKADDLIVEKRRYSAFIQGSSNIDQILRGFGIDTVLITGTLTNVCCESSARDAMMLNFRTVMVTDGNAATTDEEHNATLSAFYGQFGDVQTVTEAMQSLERGDKGRAAA